MIEHEKDNRVKRVWIQSLDRVVSSLKMKTLIVNSVTSVTTTSTWMMRNE